MENLDNKLLGEKIRKIRESRNLTLKELGKALGVSESTVSKLENGDRGLKGEEIPVLFRVLNCTSMELFGDESLPLISENSLKMRAGKWVSDNTKQEIKGILIRLGRQIKNLLALEDKLGIKFEESSPKMKLPIPRSEREMNSQAEVLANKIRTSWNIGIDPVWNLEALLEQHSIILVGWHLPDELSGLCAPHEGRSVILIDSNEPKQRQRFSLCHELCHSITDISDGLVLTRKGYNKGGRDKYTYIENRADLFAGKLLLPLEAVHIFVNHEGLDLNNLTSYAVMRLAYNFGLSGLAVLHTLRSYGAISWSKLHKLEVDIYSVDLRDIQKRPPLEIWCDNLAQRWNSIPRLVRLGFHAYFDYTINQGALAELLDKPMSELDGRLKEYKNNFLTN